MIDDFNNDRTGWARFSDDLSMRYRLARSLTGQPLFVQDEQVFIDLECMSHPPKRVVFLMLNPSTADAFKLDPTVKRCAARAARMGADVLEVVNLFAFRSPYPEDLKSRMYGSRGDDSYATQQLVHACRGANTVIAAWGNHGALDRRDQIISGMLSREAIELHCLGFTTVGHPLHPLARGKHFVPDDRELVSYLR